MPLRRRRMLWLFLPVAAVVGLLAVFLRRPPAVEVAAPDRQVVAQVLTASGQVEGVQSAELAPDTPGVLAELLVEEGDRVRAGQAVARIVDTTAKAELAEADAALAAADAQRDEMRLDLARQPQFLAQAEGEANAALADARGRVSRAEAQLRELQAGGASEEVRQAEAAVLQARRQVELARQQYQRARKLADADAAAAADLQTAQARVTEAEARVQSARDALAEAERDFARYQALYAAGSVSRVQRDRAETARAAARNALAQSEAQRDAARIALQRQAELLATARHAEEDDAARRLEIAEAALDAAQSRAREVAGPARAEALARQTAEVRAARAALQAVGASTRARLAYISAEPVSRRVARTEAQALQARRALESRRARLAALTIAAPFAGQVVAVHSRPGAVVSAAQPVLAVSRMEDAEVRVGVDEREISHVRVGEEVIVITDAYPDVELLGHVLRAGARVETQSGVVPVTVRLRTRPAWLRSGMTADASFQLERPREHLVVPPAAVRRDGADSAVFVVANGVVAIRQVRAGNSSARGVVILDGLAEADLVVLDPSRVKPGARVRAVRKGRP